jgi:hypothetical protein
MSRNPFHRFMAHRGLNAFPWICISWASDNQGAESIESRYRVKERSSCQVTPCRTNYGVSTIICLASIVSTLLPWISAMNRVDIDFWSDKWVIICQAFLSDDLLDGVKHGVGIYRGLERDFVPLKGACLPSLLKHLTLLFSAFCPRLVFSIVSVSPYALAK